MNSDIACICKTTRIVQNLRWPLLYLTSENPYQKARKLGVKYTILYYYYYYHHHYCYYYCYYYYCFIHSNRSRLLSLALRLVAVHCTGASRALNHMDKVEFRYE